MKPIIVRKIKNKKTKDPLQAEEFFKISFITEKLIKYLRKN